MNYRHLYHAGNFADVVKHVILVELIQAMQAKAKSFCYLDTHAGIGRYNLNSIQANKTGEYNFGIAPVLNAKCPPKELQAYLSIVKKFNPAMVHTSVQFYPGSPCIAQQLLRPQDTMIFNELQLEDYHTLRAEFYAEPRIAVHNRDAYEFLLAMLPPQVRRGLILIDPAYEKVDEFKQAYNALQKALKRFPTGVYALWMPIKDRYYKKFYRELAANTGAEILLITLNLAKPPHRADGLIGSAVLIINPPFQIEKSLHVQLAWLWKLWSAAKGAGGWTLERHSKIF